MSTTVATCLHVPACRLLRQMFKQLHHMKFVPLPSHPDCSKERQVWFIILSFFDRDMSLFRVRRKQVSPVFTSVPREMVCVTEFLSFVVGFGQGWYRYFCQFRITDAIRRTRQIKFTPVGHQQVGLVCASTFLVHTERGITKIPPGNLTGYFGLCGQGGSVARWTLSSHCALRRAAG